MTQKIKLPSKGDFYKLYITDNLSIEELKEYYKVGRSTIDNWIHTFQIKKPKDLIRICKERANLKKFGYTNVALIPGYRKKTHFSIPMPSYDDFYKNYIVENKSRAELCEHYKVGKSTIDKWISILKIKKPQNLINKSIENYMINKYSISNVSKLIGIKEKKINTMKQNNSYNKSQDEEFVYQKLIEKYGHANILRQYKSKDYPFPCDFYVETLNLYIECNFHWTHHYEPFNEKNKEHIELLRTWTQKHTSYYDNAIHVWTKADPKKLKTFIENKLNHKIFYNLEQFYEWYNSI